MISFKYHLIFILIEENLSICLICYRNSILFVHIDKINFRKKYSADTFLKNSFEHDIKSND